MTLRTWTISFCLVTVAHRPQVPEHALHLGLDGPSSSGRAKSTAELDPLRSVLFLENIRISEDAMHIYGTTDAIRHTFQSFVHEHAPEDEENLEAPLPNGRRWKGGCWSKEVDKEIDTCWLNDLPKVKVVFHHEDLNPSRDCDNELIREEIAFTLSRHLTENMWHLHNDNILGIVYMIQHAPTSFSCENDTLRCNLPKHLYDFPPAGSSSTQPTQHSIVMEAAIDALFDEQSLYESVRAKKQVCFRHFVWGQYRPKLFYGTNKHLTHEGFDRLSKYEGAQEYWKSSFVRHAAQNAVAALNHFLRSASHLEQRNEGFYSKRNSKSSSIKAIYVRRDDTSRNLNQHSVEKLMSFCAEHGWDCSECCDWRNESIGSVLSRFGQADVVMGAHGAGLTHVLYAKPGAVLIDFGLEATWQFMFAMMADANRGLQVSAPVDKDTHPWTALEIGQTLEYVENVCGSYIGISAGRNLDPLPESSSLEEITMQVQQHYRDTGIEADLDGM